jgi:two-component system nitrate/nitrite sensor histidine kinase NarQ
MVHLYLPREAVITPDQARLLADLSPAIVLAINAMGRLSEEARLAMVLEEEWRQIARYIHDTLGHNLSYLRLSLDRLASDGDVQDPALLKEELTRLGEVANLAYWQMRMSLADLNIKNPTNLAETMLNNLQILKEHTRLATRFNTYGSPRRLPNFVRRRVLFIVSEILSNLEQHSSASWVDVTLAWEEDHACIVITDDGQAYSPTEQPSKPGHFGLRIIKECTSEINGQLEYESVPEVGNRVSLSFPLFTQPTDDQQLFIVQTESASPSLEKEQELSRENNDR